MYINTNFFVFININLYRPNISFSIQCVKTYKNLRHWKLFISTMSSLRICQRNKRIPICHMIGFCVSLRTSVNRVAAEIVTEIEHEPFLLWGKNWCNVLLSSRLFSCYTLFKKYYLILRALYMYVCVLVCVYM